MTKKNKPAIRKVVFIVLILITSISLLSSYNTARRYDKLYQQYADQVIIHNELMKTHTALTDAYWNLQQSIIKQ